MKYDVNNVKVNELKKDAAVLLITDRVGNYMLARYSDLKEYHDDIRQEIALATINCWGYLEKKDLFQAIAYMKTVARNEIRQFLGAELGIPNLPKLSGVELQRVKMIMTHLGSGGYEDMLITLNKPSVLKKTARELKMRASTITSLIECLRVQPVLVSSFETKRRKH